MSDSIEDTIRALQSRSQQPYDGVQGTLPQWIPANFHTEFESTRNTLLIDGYTPENIQHFMNECAEFERIALENPDDPNCLVFFPDTPLKIMEAVYKLARFREAVRLGDEQGLAYLTDTKTSGLVTKGKKFQTHRKKGSISKKTKHIQELATTYLDKTAKELLKIADRKIIGRMSDRTFANHVSAFRTHKL